VARPVVLSNGQMFVGLNETGLVHDFYYPYVGLDNLTTARSVHHKIGVWANGKFSWVDSEDWQTIVDFDQDALVANISLTNHKLGVAITTNDFIDSSNNSLIRRLTVENISNETQEIKLFLHQVFEISRSGRADTAYYVPEDNYILDYKGRCALIIYCQDNTGKSFDQYAIGNYGIEGKAGTYLDAEDGELSNNNIEHGGVDSVMRLTFNIQPKQTAKVDYWIIASSSQYESEQIHSNYL
jgi:GH15 family glucan-1,4-alpha-glucosidase